MKLKIILLLTVLFCVYTSFAQSVNILGDPYDGNPYATINDAVTAANGGDVILITGIHTESISFGKSITLRGTDPTKDIIQAAENPSNDGTGTNVINVISGVGNVLTVTIENLGIRHGNSSSNGGGINVDKITDIMTLNNLIIEGNHSALNGGGLAIAGSNAEIINCTIQNNTSTQDGGGIIAAPNNGAGIDSSIDIKQSLIHNNQGRNGGGMFINGNSGFGNDYRINVDIENTTIANNTASSGTGAAGGGGIWARSALWTTNDGGDGTSANTSLQLVHVTMYDNTHSANIKSGIQFTSTGGVNTNFSAFNSIIVAANAIAKRAINFANSNTTEIINCILGGLENNGPFNTIIDDPTKNNQRGRTATQAGLSGNLTDEGGNTQVITILENSAADDFCTATVPIPLPTVDQRGYNRVSAVDAGAYEFDAGFVCKAPTELANVSIAATGGSFIWTAIPDATQDYEWAVVEQGGDPDEPSDIIFSGVKDNNRFAITGLNNDTDYELYIKSICDVGVESNWSGALNFRTELANLIRNSRFSSTGINPDIERWEGYGTGSRVDELIGKSVGFINLSDGLFRQDFNVVPGVEYLISFNYRWVATTGSTNPNDLSPVIRNPITGNSLQTFTLTENDTDVWYTANFVYTHDSSAEFDAVRLLFFKGTAINEFSVYNVTVVENIDLSTSYDYIYKNGSWSNDPINSTSSDNIFVLNGKVNIDNTIIANNFEVSPWADVDVEGVLELSNELSIDTGSEVTFKSGLTNTGQLESGSLVGEVFVERYIPAATENRRAFRYVTSSVNTSTVIRNNWQERLRNNLHKFGTQITGPDVTGNGLDVTETGNYSMFTYDTDADDWANVTNTNNPGSSNLQAGKGYALMIRGDRRHNLASNPADAPNSDVILRAKGELVSGDVSFDLNEEADSFTLIGNPYQAIVDLSQVNSTNMNQTFYWAWDANMATRGAYVAVDLTDSSPTASDVASRFVQPGQSFFVQTIADGAASITFSESNKAVDELVTGIFSEDQNPKLKIMLYTEEAFLNGSREADVIQLKFSENGNNEVNSNDAMKFGNFDENLAILNEANYLSIENRALPIDGETIPLYTAGYTSTNYTFVVAQQNFPENVEVYVVDNYSSTQTLINDENNQVSFSVDASIPASLDANRFSLVFETTPLSTTDLDWNINLSLSPNPSINGNFSIHTQNLDTAPADVAIFNLLGQAVFQQEYFLSENAVLNITTDNLTAGIYLVQLKQNQKSFTAKLILK